MAAHQQETAENKRGHWERIVARMREQGWPVTRTRCEGRLCKLKLQQEGLRTKVEWTPQLVNCAK